MARGVGLALLGLVGCVAPADERVREYNADGLHLFAHGSYARAAQTFEAALALRPDDPGLIYNAARSYERAGGDAKAEALYRACLRRDGDHAACRHGLAALLLRQNRRNEAVSLAEGWLAQSPQRSGPYALDGWLWHQTGDLPRAQARLQQALEIDPRDGRALAELALVYEALRRPERALVLYERALEQSPNQPEVTERLQRLQAQGVKRPRPD